MKMTKFFVIAVATMMMTAQVAHAKRFGGGGFRSSPSVARSYSAPKAPAPTPVNMTKAPAAPMGVAKAPAVPAAMTPTTATVRPASTTSGLLIPLAVGAAMMGTTSAVMANNPNNTPPVKQDPCADKEKAKELKECQKPKQ